MLGGVKREKKKEGGRYISAPHIQFYSAGNGRKKKEKEAPSSFCVMRGGKKGGKIYPHS